MMNSSLSFEHDAPMNRLRKRFSVERICNLSIPKPSSTQSTEFDRNLMRRMSLSALDDRRFWDDQHQPSQTQPSARKELSPPALVVCSSDDSLHSSSCSIVSSNGIGGKKDIDYSVIDTTRMSPGRKTSQGLKTLLHFTLFFLLGVYTQQIRTNLASTTTGHHATYDSTKILRPKGNHELYHHEEMKLLLSEIQELDAIMEESTTIFQQNETSEKNPQNERDTPQPGRHTVEKHKDFLRESVEELSHLLTELESLSAENIALQRALSSSKTRATGYEREIELLLTEIREFEEEI